MALPLNKTFGARDSYEYQMVAYALMASDGNCYQPRTPSPHTTNELGVVDLVHPQHPS